MTALVPTITDSGLRAVLAADNAGLDAVISHIALGNQAHSPTRIQTALKNEQQRLPVAAGARVGDHQIHLEALADGEADFWVREVGFFLESGEMLAIWSDPETPLAYKAAGQDLLLAFDLSLTALPADSVTVEVSSPSLNLHFASELVAMARAHARQALRETRQFDALRTAGLI